MLDIPITLFISCFVIILIFVIAMRSCLCIITNEWSDFKETYPDVQLNFKSCFFFITEDWKKSKEYLLRQEVIDLEVLEHHSNILKLSTIGIMYFGMLVIKELGLFYK